MLNLFAIGMKRMSPTTIRIGLIAWNIPIGAFSPITRSQYFGESSAM